MDKLYGQARSIVCRPLAQPTRAGLGESRAGPRVTLMALAAVTPLLVLVNCWLSLGQRGATPLRPVFGMAQSAPARLVYLGINARLLWTYGSADALAESVICQPLALP